MDLRKKRIMMKIGVILCILIILVSAYLAISKILTDRQSNKEYADLVTEVVTTDVYNPEIPIMVDFEKLKEINSDVVGWIYIPCLKLSYPVMQARDNDYYLHRTIRRTELFAGSIFMDAFNKPDFSDPNTLVYGHNMLNGSMFGKLWHITYKDAAKEDPYFWILTPEKAYRYKIFSSYATKSDSKTYRAFVLRNTEFKNWCYEMRSWSLVDFGEYPFTQESRVVTLSTCSGTSKTERTIVQGVQEKEYEYMVQKTQTYTYTQPVNQHQGN